jgi:hypothetical protein
MAAQHHVRQTFPFDEIDYVADVCGKADAGAEQVRALAQAGERRREHGVTMAAQHIGGANPAPGAVHEDEGFAH